MVNGWVAVVFTLAFAVLRDLRASAVNSFAV